jgi:hypothetical protein
MKVRQFLAAAAMLAATLSLGACSYNVSPPATGAANIYSQYSDKIPGRWLLVVEASALNTTARPVGVVGSAHNYPISGSEAFRQAARATVANIVEDVELVATTAPMAETNAVGTVGQILIRVDSFQPRLQIIPGFWSATASASAEISAGMTVDGPGGRLLGTSAGASRTADSPSGSFAEGGAQALAEAVGRSQRELLERLGERLSNAPQVRQAATAATRPAAPGRRAAQAAR